MTGSVRYRSTRGHGEAVAFREALLTGLAPDGGLFIPTWIPSIEKSSWREAGSFAELGTSVLAPWIGNEIAPGALRALLTDALDFPVPLVPLSGAGWDGVFVLELFHGPTLSFKDFGARTMARFMAHFLRDEPGELTILVATSGDTGSAVADGFAGLPGIHVVLLYPKGQVSPTQERQLIVERPGVRTYAVEGTFDDCQRMVKSAFVDPELDGVTLSSANSINIGRLLPQMLYYFEATRAGRLDEVIFCVPSGNLGNLTAGVLASLSGLPVSRFLAAHNANDFFPAFLQAGEAEFRPSIQTLSNAMDVGAPSNFERIQAMYGGDLAALRRDVVGRAYDDARVVAEIGEVYRRHGYLLDPHGAIGWLALRDVLEEAGPDAAGVFLATAHPAKFREVVEPAIGAPVPLPPALAEALTRPRRSIALPAEYGALLELLRT
jgi:threonine synthase